jgi:hypothetical protein
VRLCLVAAKPTDAVTYGLLPAAARLGLEVYLLTDQPDGHAGVLARGRTDPGAQPRIVGCDVHDARALIGRISALPRADAVFSNSDHLQAQTALAADYFGLPGKDWRSCLRARNKPLMRRRLAETGAEKVTAVEIAAGDEPPGGLPYPVAACEKELWRQARHVLTEAAAEHAWPPELRAVLAGVPLPAKANLRVRWARDADRDAGYVTVPNPLRQSEPRRLEPAQLDLAQPEPA